MSSSHPFPPEYDDDPRSDRQRPAHDQLVQPRFRVPGPEQRLPLNAGDDPDPRAPYTGLHPLGKSRTSNKVANQKTKSGGTAEITVYGNFPLPVEWATDAKEVAVMKEKDKELWSPTTRDFAAIATKGSLCADFKVLLADIVFTNAGSKRIKGAVRRINIITHGDKDFIAMQGQIIPNPAKVVVNLGAKGAITIGNLENLTTPGLTITAPVANKSRRFTLQDVRDALSPEAELYLYSCHSGADKPLRDKLADVLQIRVLAFRERIAFCPKFQESPPLVLDRKRIAVGSCSATAEGKKKVSNFRNLDPDRHSNPKPGSAF